MRRIKAVASRLGYEGTGKNIERRVSEVIDGMMRPGRLDAGVEAAELTWAPR